MENQICIAKPREDGMDIFSSTQWMDFTQDAIAGALGIPANELVQLNTFLASIYPL